MTMATRRVFSGSAWEPEVGYCRAVRAGDLVFVSGTAPAAPGGGIAAKGDPYGQTRRCIEIVAGALRELGADLSDVVRTRMYVTDASRWKEYGRAHREAFGAHPPATAMIEVKGFVDPEMLVEIEVDAVVPRSRRGSTARPARAPRAPRARPAPKRSRRSRPRS
jgi:enamine deaminase RidA (YjgF/YER057c/UK114 family)